MFKRARNQNFRLVVPTRLEPAGDVFEVENRCSVGTIIPIDDHVAPDGRVMEVLGEHLCQGWLEGYVLTGRHGIFVTYEAFAMVTTSMVVQHTKWLEKQSELPWRKPVPSLNLLLTSTCWRNDHNGFSHQGPGLIDTVLAMKGTVGRIYLPPDANCLLSVADHSLPQPELRQPDRHRQATAVAVARHGRRRQALCRRRVGLALGEQRPGGEPDVVLAAAGDIPTLEVAAAAWLLRKHAPSLKVRVVNIVDLMCLPPPAIHPHGLEEAKFIELFTVAKPVVFAFHGYQRAIHAIVHGRTNTERFHVRGFIEEGTTTTPFRHGRPQQDEPLSPVHGGATAIRLPPGRPLMEWCQEMLAKHQTYTREHFEDMPEVRDWIWADTQPYQTPELRPALPTGKERSNVNYNK